MKKRVLAVLLILFAAFGAISERAYGQNTSSIDLLLLLDTSSAMNSSYDNVSNYLSGPFLKEFLRMGDTFHLIPFANNPRLDAARRVTGVGDVETIIGRMLLQYPIENASNVGSALMYTEQYITTLPNRLKKIVLITTGSTASTSLVQSARARLSPLNATIDYVQVTPGQALSSLPSSGRTPAAQTTSVTAPAAVTTTPSAAATTPSTTTTTTPSASTTQAQQTTPSAVTTQQTTTTTPPRTTPAQTTTTTTTTTPTTTPSASTTQAQQTTPSASTTQQTTTTTTTTPATTTTPSAEVSRDGTTGIVSDNAAGATTTEGTASKDTYSTQRPVTTSTAAEKSSGGNSLLFVILIIILALLILGLIIFLLSRKLSSSPRRVMSQVSSSSSDDRRVDHSGDLANYAAGQTKQRSTPYDYRPVRADAGKSVVINPQGPVLLNLFVEDQNTSIGKRNIHSLKSGYSLTVGGGKADDYLIFLVPLPANIGEIRREGSSLTFIPRKAKYFPDIGTSEVRDCINKTIRIVSDKKYEMRFRFEMYEDPLIALNRLLHSVKVPG